MPHTCHTQHKASIAVGNVCQPQPSTQSIATVNCDPQQRPHLHHDWMLLLHVTCRGRAAVAALLHPVGVTAAGLLMLQVYQGPVGGGRDTEAVSRHPHCHNAVPVTQPPLQPHRSLAGGLLLSGARGCPADPAGCLREVNWWGCIGAQWVGALASSNAGGSWSKESSGSGVRCARLMLNCWLGCAQHSTFTKVAFTKENRK